MAAEVWFTWLQAVVRWIHVFAAILWIGQTYLFNFFEANLEPVAATGIGEAGDQPDEASGRERSASASASKADAPSDRDNVAGSLWMVHGGGFYLLEKQRLPELMPRTLHWFKWEAAGTWISGAVLIGLTYYMGGLLVEPGMSYWTAAAAGVGSIVAGWFAYDWLLRSPVGRNEALFAVVGLGLVVALHAGLEQVMSARSAWIHVGAVLGTIMAANVWLRILPSHHDMLAVAERGEVPDPSLMELGPQRSRHNSYTVVPLVFVMIGNHYPTISYAHPHAPWILAAVFVAGWAAARWMRSEPDG